MIGRRTRSREIALQALFCHDVRSSPLAGAVDTVLEQVEAVDEVKEFSRELVEGVLDRLPEIDELIAQAAENWEVARLAVVDRNVLRLAVFELLARDDIPTKVSINEAIELGKRYSTAQSGAFINGILDRIRKDLGLPAEEADELLADDAPPDDESPRVLDIGAPPDARQA